MVGLTTRVLTRGMSAMGQNPDIVARHQQVRFVPTAGISRTLPWNGDRIAFLGGVLKELRSNARTEQSRFLWWVYNCERIGYLLTPYSSCVLRLPWRR
jgi:hypothetical protein